MAHTEKRILKKGSSSKKGNHSDEKEDKKLIKKMVKKGSIKEIK